MVQPGIIIALQGNYPDNLIVYLQGNTQPEMRIGHDIPGLNVSIRKHLAIALKIHHYRFFGLKNIMKDTLGRTITVDKSFIVTGSLIGVVGKAQRFLFETGKSDIKIVKRFERT